MNFEDLIDIYKKEIFFGILVPVFILLLGVGVHHFVPLPEKIGVQETHSASWYNVNWQYRKKVTIDNTKVPSTQTSFPVLINTTDLDWRDTGNGGHVGQADGGDILFTSSDGTTKLDHEIDRYSSSSGELVAWVRIPSLSGSSDTEVYMYYGNASALSQENPTGVWDTDFMAVYHLEETDIDGGSGDIKDSTSNVRDGTTHDMTTADQVAGLAGGSFDFDGNNDYVDSTIDPPSSVFTIDAWIYPKESGREQHIAEFGNTQFYMSGVDRLGTPSWSSISGNAILSLSNWHHVVITRDGSSVEAYVDGQPDDSTGVLGTDPYDSFFIGTIYSLVSVLYFNGQIDEVRTSSIARSADWILTEFNNMNSPGTFYSVGAEEASGGSPTAPTVTTNAASSISTSTAALSGDANPNGSSTSGWFRYSTTDPGTCDDSFGTRVPVSGGTDLGSGTSSASFGENITGLTDNTTYYFCAIASNAGGTSFGSVLNFDTVFEDWYDYSWPYRKKVTISSSQVPSNQTNFPVVIDVSDSDLAKEGSGGYVGKNNGGDILFTDAVGVKLDHEIVRYISGSGQLEAWVEVPSLSGSVDTDIYMYYGNAGAVDQWNTSGTWSNGFVAIQHFEEDEDVGGGTFTDSTSNGNDSTYVELNDVGSEIDISGVVGNAVQFGGVYGGDDRIVLADNGSLDITGAMTVSAWIYAESGPGGEGRVPVSHHKYNGGSQRGWQFGDEWNGANYFKFQTYDSSGSDSGSHSTYFSSELNTWRYMSGTYEPSTAVRLYMDGTLISSDTSGVISSILYDTDAVTIGRRSGDAQSEFDGVVDELRISNVARSADWTLTEYNNMFNPGAFYTFGPQETSIVSSNTSGSIVSSTFDTELDNGVGINSIMWLGTAGVGGVSTVKFQIASAYCSSGSDGSPNCTQNSGWGGSKTSGDGAFVGSDGTSATYYGPVAPGTPVVIPAAHHIGNRFLRYLVQVDRDASSTSPIIQDVILNISP